MSKIRRPLLWLQLLTAFVVFMIVVGLAIRFQNPLKEFVLIPLLYVMWVAELVLKSFDQRCLWVMALVVAVFLSLAFSYRGRSPEDFYLRSAPHRFLDAGRIRYWRRQIRIGSSALYTSGFHRSEMSRLVIETLAYREGVSPEEIKEELYAGRINVPAEVRYILGLDDAQENTDKPLGFLRRTSRWFNQIFEWFTTPKFSPNPRLEKVAGYLESLMEVDDDIGDR